MSKKQIKVNDEIQKNYHYFLTEKPGKNFQPDFQPDLTPKEMLALGVFGGRYLRDCREEFPADWFKNAKLHPEGVPGHSLELNFFKVEASQSLKIWQAKDWLHPDDPRGWFQWYCRYYQGRRHIDDQRQIKRWRAMARHLAQVTKNCRTRDFNCRPKQRQALLHWAYDSREI